MSYEILDQLAEILEQRKTADPDSSYVARLYREGLDGILKKVGEEATETILAAKDGDKEHVIYEVTDLWFHSMVMLAHLVLHPGQVLQEMQRRFGLSGLTEKEARGK